MDVDLAGAIVLEDEFEDGEEKVGQPDSVPVS
jgi:hypothetical protein